MIKIVLALILKLQHVLSESSISFCSSSSTNPNKENYRISNLSLQSQGKSPRVTRIVNDVSNILGNKSNSANSNSSTTPKPTTNSNSTNTLGRTTNLNSNSSRYSTADDILAPNQQLSLSPSFCNLSNASKTAFPIHSLVEGSLEYREMKCLYLSEKQQTEEWRMD
ncbi:unnamed protein product [Rotaria magnacalcarata]|uniref:Uncharacterized protein n=1 Tax=Rotaria magnacalcarata TaxID=392030 RepID=A0A816LMK0_9BILA|nr:unnamed protein product [Rotaria magnacalcarata]